MLVCIAVCALAGCATSPATRLTDLAGVQQRADGAYAHQDWATAAAGYRALTQAVPDNAAYWFRLGNSYARLDEPALAVTAYQAALQRDPKIVPAWHNLGAVLLQESQAAFQQAAASARPEDPLRQASALLAGRIGAVRDGASSTAPPSASVPAASRAAAAGVPAQRQPAAVRLSFASPLTIAGVPDRGGVVAPSSSTGAAVSPAAVPSPIRTAPSANAGGPTGGEP